MSDHRFQINLSGIIDLLSKHLYSAPEVYLRELLQNGVDAIQARATFERKEPSEFAESSALTVEVMGGDQAPTLMFTDSGVGLTEEEIHRFLSTIGDSSKRDPLARERTDYLGQFGIGLLSCFVVSEEIVVFTKSARTPDAPVLKWQGRSDGTYSIAEAQYTMSQGTHVFLRAKPEMKDYFKLETVRESLSYYGGLLPVPIIFRSSEGEGEAPQEQRINDELAPWQRSFATKREEWDAVMLFGQKVFNGRFMDWIPLRSPSGGVEGIAYVMPTPMSLKARSSHRVYLKHMLLSESVDNLLPDWAFFVKCIVNVKSLRPTASRESFFNDDSLRKARDELGTCLISYLKTLAETDPGRLQHLIKVHYLSIKALAASDDEFFAIIADWLPFPTTRGEMTLRDYREEFGEIRYTSTVDAFRQIAQVSAAQDICVINAGYVYDRELIERLPKIYPDLKLIRTDASSLVDSLQDLSIAERDDAADFLLNADAVLSEYSCRAELKRFEPASMAALYTSGEEANFRRSIELAKEKADAHWSGLLDALAGEAVTMRSTELCFNARNPLITRLLTLKDESALRRAIEMIYVQALLLGHHPLRSGEMELLTHGLLDLINWGLDGGGSRE